MTKDSHAELVVRTFVPADALRVRELFADGIMEFALVVEDEARRYVEHSLADDLADIPAHYLDRPRNHFWVVGTGVDVLGMVGVQERSEDEAELRRMSVSSAARRQGIGRKLLATVDEFCRWKGYRRISLSTVTMLQPAMAMYANNGYKLVKEEDWGGVGVRYFEKELASLT